MKSINQNKEYLHKITPEIRKKHLRRIYIVGTLSFILDYITILVWVFLTKYIIENDIINIFSISALILMWAKILLFKFTKNDKQ